VCCYHKSKSYTWIIPATFPSRIEKDIDTTWLPVTWISSFGAILFPARALLLFSVDIGGLRLLGRHMAAQNQLGAPQEAQIIPKLQKNEE